MTRSGTGQFRVRGRMYAAHRLSYLLEVGVPSGVVRRACGTRGCVRPDHLVLQPRRGGPTSLARPASVRFWEHVDRRGECWIWTGSTDREGFGQFRDGKMWRAHRAAWTFEVGDLPTSVHLVHTCRNPACVRPSHLVRLRAGKPGETPTVRQLEFLVSVLRDSGAAGVDRAAERLGVRSGTVAAGLAELRRRLGVASVDEAVRLLDETDPEWRNVAASRVNERVHRLSGGVGVTT
jgi:HNH endonuclease